MRIKEGSSLKIAGLIIFVLTFTITANLFYRHNKDKDMESLKILNTSFELIVNNSISNFAWDYVQWTPIQRAIVENENALIDEVFEAAELDKKYIDKIMVIPRPEGLAEDIEYEIRTVNNNLVAYLNIFDRNHLNFKKSRVVAMEINEDNILADLERHSRDFYLVENGKLPFAFGLKITQETPYLSYIEFFFSFMVSAGLVMILWYLYNYLFSFQWKTTGLEKIMFLLESRDGYTIDHSRNVSVIACFIAKKLSLSRRKILRIEAAAKLHDIGKLAISTDILNKCGKLDSEECKIIKNHPTFGVEIVKHFREFEDLVPGILYHHERLDGSGYPAGLNENEIPVMAQIIAVADVFEAMTSNRPYRKAIKPMIVLELMKSMALNQKFVEILVNNRDEIIDMLNIEMKETPSFEMEFAEK